MTQNLVIRDDTAKGMRAMTILLVGSLKSTRYESQEIGGTARYKQVCPGQDLPDMQRHTVLTDIRW
jgi:hypothetical protein